MVCDPSQNNINIPPPGPGPSLPGLIPPIDIPGIPLPDLGIPDGIPEDIIDLIERIFALFPQGIKFIPNADAFMKDVWDALASLMNQLAPFLAFYKFIQALLNIILCIIDILCALMNPWATLRAVIRLFKVCLPDFLSLFPWIALLIMILALILLLIALIKYLIEIIIAYIKQIIENILVLTRAITTHSTETIIAAVNKLSYLMCMIENLFSMLMAIAAILAIIQPLMGIFGRGVCSKGQYGCCTEDFCPGFISGGGVEGQFSGTGKLTYYREVGIPDDFFQDWMANVAGFVQRSESWQMEDNDNDNFRFLDIITPSPEFGFIYWPEGETYDKNANIVKVPYTMNLNVTLDPSEWGNSSDTGGERLFSIQDVVINKKPTVQASDETGRVNINYADLFSGNLDGAVSFVGGSVWEYDGEDGYTRYSIENDDDEEVPATIETFLHRDNISDIPDYDDGYTFLQVDYNFRPNFPSLIDKKMITMMCQPDAASESATLNAEFADHDSVFEKTGPLPDIDGAIDCLNTALAKFRGNLNEESAAVFEQESVGCLTDLLAQATDFYCRGAVEAADQYSSDMSLDPEIQFVERPITVNVILRDKSGTQIGLGIDDALGECVADGITAKATFGSIGSFEYDGYGSFNADINSSEAGTGEVKVFILGKVFSEVINRDEDDVATEIVERSLPYEFIDHTTTSYRRPDENSGKARFGNPDVAEDS